MSAKSKCDCLEKSSKEFVDFVKKRLEAEGKNIAEYNESDSGFVNRALSFSDGGGWKLILPFEVKYTPIKADGTKGKERIYKTNVFPSFCPFCGNSNSN